MTKPRNSKAEAKASMAMESIESLTRLTTENKSLKLELESYRLNNADFVKATQASQMTLKSLTADKLQMAKELHAARILINRYEKVFKDVFGQTKDMSGLLINFSDSLFKVMNMTNKPIGHEQEVSTRSEESSKSGVQLSNTVQTKSPVKAVQPMISGHTIQNPTINMRQSDTQQIAALIQNQSEISNFSNRTVINCMSRNSDNSQNRRSISQNNISVSQNSVTAPNISISLQNSTNNDSNHELSDVDGTENCITEGMSPDLRRLSTIRESSDFSTNSTAASTLRPSDLSNRSTGSNPTRKRSFLPLESKSKLPRHSVLFNKSQNSGNSLSSSLGNSFQNTVSSIGMSSRGSSTGLRSVSEDPLEGPSTLLDETEFSVNKNKEGFSHPNYSSTPMDIDRQTITISYREQLLNLDKVTTRKTKKSDEVVENVNLSKSLNDLDGCDSNVEDRNTPIRPKTKKSFHRIRCLSDSLSDETINNTDCPVKATSPEIVLMTTTLEEMQNCSVIISPKKKTPKKRGRPRKLSPLKIKISKKLSPTIKKSVGTRRTLRKSRSYSPEIRQQPDVDEDQTIVNTVTNPIVQIVRLDMNENNNRKKRRSRSFSPQLSDAGSTKSTDSGGNIVSKRGRRVNTVNYNEPSLRLKMRRK